MSGTQNHSGIVGIKHHLCHSVAFEIEFPHWMQLLIILKAMTRLERILNKTQTRFDLKIALTAVETYNGEDCRSTRVAVEHCPVAVIAYTNAVVMGMEDSGWCRRHEGHMALGSWHHLCWHHLYTTYLSPD